MQTFDALMPHSDLISHTNVIGSILPSDLASCEIVGSLETVRLDARDAAHVRNAVSKRQVEFAAGRRCARQALYMLGIRSWVDLSPTPARSPHWPEGFVGTITHCDGYCAAAVGDRRFRSIGIDAERVASIPQSLWDHLFTKRDIERILASPEPDAASTLVFSAKEAFFKLQHPVLGLWPTFQDVDVAFDADGFSIQSQNADLARCFPTPPTGRYLRYGDVIVTALAWRKESGTLASRA